MSNNIAQQIKDFNNAREKAPLRLKYKAMAESPFRFFRGSCSLFYEELMKNYPFPASPYIWACGDLHIENFGSFKGNNRLVYFDMNDFDEALLAPVFWEICRLLVSVQVAADETGFSKKEKTNLGDILLYHYRHTLKKGKSITIERDSSRGLIKKLVNKVAERKEGDLIKKRTDKINPDKLLVCDRLFALPKQERKSILNSFNGWLADNAHKGLKAIDAGFRIAGTGSIGVKRYLLLLVYDNNPQKKILVDAKQALPPAAGEYIQTAQPVWHNQAERIITVQEMMQHVSPAFLSSFQYDDNWFVVKELQPMADKVTLSQTVRQPGHIENYLADLGVLAASGQLRSSGRLGSVTADELSYFATAEGWVNILAEWAASYTEQVKQDYAIYKQAYQDGFFAG